MTCANKNSTSSSSQWKYMTRCCNAIMAILWINSSLDSFGAISRGDTSCNAFHCLNRHSEGGAVAGVIAPPHKMQTQTINHSLFQRQANKPAPIFGHEIYILRSGHLRSNNKVAFILAVFIINDNYGLTVTHILDNFING